MSGLPHARSQVGNEGMPISQLPWAGALRRLVCEHHCPDGFAVRDNRRMHAFH
jgi:hypothetical protein